MMKKILVFSLLAIIALIAMVTEERKPLFGKVVGHSEAVAPSETTGTMLQKHYRQRSAD